MHVERELLRWRGCWTKRARGRTNSGSGGRCCTRRRCCAGRKCCMRRGGLLDEEGEVPHEEGAPLDEEGEAH